MNKILHFTLSDIWEKHTTGFKVFSYWIAYIYQYFVLVCKISLIDIGLVQVSLREGKPSIFDVSVVDGYNLPISVSPKPSNPNCSIEGCRKNINSICPEKLRVSDQSGNIVACKSACLAFNRDEFCCRNAYMLPKTCNASKYSKIFKEACPSYISYAYDTPPALRDCDARDYAIVFCPSHKSSGHPSM